MPEPARLQHRPTQRAALAQAEPLKQYLAFVLGKESLAFDIGVLKEILSFQGLTEIPLMPAMLRGVINLRGSVVPVLDLAVRLGRPATVPSRRTCIIVVEIPAPEGSLELGVLVDGVSEVLELGASDVEPPPRLGKDARSGLIAGVGKAEGRFILLLDAAELLSEQDLEALDAVLAEAPPEP